MNLKLFHNILLHCKNILIHKWLVFKFMARLGLPWQGIKHDLSKFSKTEFIESIKFFQGNRSPIDAAKEKQGYSLAWLHHKGRNPHHYEYWIDYIDKGGVSQIIPYKYAAEMVCDYIAAGKVYLNKKWTEKSPYEYWMQNKFNTAKIHPLLKDFFTEVFEEIAEEGLYETLRFPKMEAIYNLNVTFIIEK